MSTDFENELRDLFREKAAEAPLATPSLPASAPQQVLRRGRLHQVGTVLGSAVVVVALIVGSVAGLTRVLGEGDDQVGNADYEVFQRLTSIEAFTLGSPSDWFLVNEWPSSMLIAVEGSGGSSSACVAVPGDVVEECDDTSTDQTSSPIPVPYGLPMLQLSNVDLGLSSNVCRDGLPDDGVAMYLAVTPNTHASFLEPFPPGPMPGMPAPSSEGLCGPGSYSSFTVNGTPMFAWVGWGNGSSEEDRNIVQTTYENMYADDAWEPTQPNHVTPAYVVAGDATEEGETWRLELRPGDPNPEVTLEHSDRPAASVTLDEVLSSSSYDPELTDPIFGAIAKAATGVEFRPGTETTFLDLGQTPVAGTIAPIPPTMGAFDFDVFFIDPPADYADLGGHVIALGIDEGITPSPTSIAEPRDEFVELSGTFEGKPWTVRFVGGFAEGTACMEARIVDGAGELCPRPIATSLAGNQPSLHGWNTDALYLLAGSVPLQVVEMRLIEDDGTVVPSQSRCAMGPTGWTDPDRKVCAIALPSGGSGTLLYFDADGEVIFEDGIGWGTAEPEAPVPTPVDPVHGGTYWAVYPWLGAAGSPEADDVSAWLLQEFGIEAFPGDLSCDDGAAEALGTDAPQGIGVYFETEDEANAFADQAGLLGHEGDPVIARVTTYCLD
jgi:hypothetical protein